jgi:outer membrane protein assembly factor BamB
MDKKTEIALRKRKNEAASAETATAVAEPPQARPLAEAAPPPSAAPPQPSGWWMYHGDPEHTGYVSDSQLTSRTVAQSLTALHTMQLGGPVLSVPAVADGFVYVGLANYHAAQGGNGGALHKIDIEAGTVVATFGWDLGCDARDAHSFTGMGMTPAVANGRVYFGAFNGKFYCLDQETLAQIWVTDLRNADPAHNQPVTNSAGVPEGYPPAVMWSSPVFDASGAKLYVGCGEGENPNLFSFVFCLDTATGNVLWIFCTNQFVEGQPNQPNALPAAALVNNPPPGYTVVQDPPIIMGCSVWGSIAYDRDLGRLYCPTGNQQPEPNNNWPETPFTPELPSAGYSNGLLSLDAETGEFKGFFQVTPESNYRVSDIDIDVGSSPVIFTANGAKAVGLACKNGSYFVLDPDTMQLRYWRQLLPHMNDGSQIPTVDPHPNPSSSELNPHVTNEESNQTPNENFSGAFNTAAFYPGSADDPQSVSPRLFVALGGPNYHTASPGIDYESTPFMRAVEAATLADAWPLDDSDPPRYLNARPPMYTTAGESGLSSPAVVNDVVFCTTSKISIYAFDVRDGRLLWQDDMGMQTDGYNGGYGYCLGPAVWKNYVVAGALVFGRDGGLLRIYGLPPQPAA